MAILYPYFLRTILSVNDKLRQNIPYPHFDPACVRYEALRAVLHEKISMETVVSSFPITEYEFKKSHTEFLKYGAAGLIGIDSKQIVVDFPSEAERMVYVMKSARPWIPATKMVTLLKGFSYDFTVDIIRQLYASYGWAQGTKPYCNVDFNSLILKTITLTKTQKSARTRRKEFIQKQDKLQILIEAFRTINERGITKRYPGSRVSFEQHKKSFLSIGLLGLIDRSRPPFRNSKLGFAEEGKIIFSKIRHPEKTEKHWIGLLKTKKIIIAPTCLTNIFRRWNVDNFKSHFIGDLERFLDEKSTKEEDHILSSDEMRLFGTMRLDNGFISFLEKLTDQSVPLCNPGIFIFLQYLNKLKIYEKAAELMDIDPVNGYSWFSFLLLNISRIIRGISSLSKACRTSEMSLPITAGLVVMPCNDSVLNGLAEISENSLLNLRRYLTKAAKCNELIVGKKIAFDFEMRDFTGDDIKLKNIGKGPSPKRKICFPGFRPHIAWDTDTGAPISIEFRNGRARATTTIKRFINDLLIDSLGSQAIEHVYLDSEYTAEHIWQYIVSSDNGLGADLTMCIKQNKKVKKYINSFLETKPTWLFFDEEHTYTEQTFDISITGTDKTLHCVLKRKEKNGKLRCFGSTVENMDSKKILTEYKVRWRIENGIKDLAQNYFFDNIPGIDPHRINVHYFVVNLSRILYEMFSREYDDIFNTDKTVKMLDTIRFEFITGTNALLSRKGDTLVIKWLDAFTEKKHQAIKKLFDRLNQGSDKGLPFLGGIKIRYEIVEPRAEDFRNQCKRVYVEF